MIVAQQQKTLKELLLLLFSLSCSQLAAGNTQYSLETAAHGPADHKAPQSPIARMHSSESIVESRFR